VSAAEDLTSLPTELAVAIEKQYQNVMEHFLLSEWDDAQVDAGRFAEGALRALQWHMKGRYTPMDGKSKPNRKVVVGDAVQDTSLEPSLRLQVPQALELILDFRNNRNVAHLGGVDANKLDATCVVQLTSWVMAELIRLDTDLDAQDVQAIIDRLAERHIPVIEMVGDRPVIIDGQLPAGDRALVLLYNHNGPVSIGQLRDWTEYRNTSRWAKEVLPGLSRQRLIHVEDGYVHLLTPGSIEAERLVALAAQRSTPRH
jgi:hypothetical protein